MNESAPIVIYTKPSPTYFVAYEGVLALNEIFEIPNRDRRQGDTADNKQVYVIITNAGLANDQFLEVLDETNTVCMIHYFPNPPVTITTDARLKIRCANSTNLHAQVMVFYEKPIL
jgi:hypothetical protein